MIEKIDVSSLSALETSGSSGSILDYFSHPIHLHGHSFYVVHVGHGNYVNGRFSSSTSDIKCNSSHICTWANGTIPDFFSKYLTNGRLNDTAIRKDTVIVPAGGYVVIAFQADNKGYWFMHCHMEAHLLEGMAVIIQEYPDNQQPPIPVGINDIGNFNNWDQREPPPWKTIAIVFIVSFSVLFAVLVVIVVAFCYKRKSKKSDHQGGADLTTPILNDQNASNDIKS